MSCVDDKSVNKLTVLRRCTFGTESLQVKFEEK